MDYKAYKQVIDKVAGCGGSELPVRSQPTRQYEYLPASCFNNMMVTYVGPDWAESRNASCQVFISPDGRRIEEFAPMGFMPSYKIEKK
ncbi:hypothetical protein C4588_06265 [Candidatus Parcubacteria bacterium]|nr:MAG: hypothetical protein C4588_06265 [Candidatus Parcubacteria bacterium]